MHDFFFFSYFCACASLLRKDTRKVAANFTQQQVFVRDVGQILIYLCVKPEGHVGESGRQKALTPVTVTLKESWKRREEKREEITAGQ